MKGADIAFFTKFLFFLRSEQNAYILDQWTGKSINLLLLTDEPLIKMRYGSVEAQNTPEIYESFCVYLEDLAPLITRKSGEQVEEILFSHGKNPRKGINVRGEWRQYVVDSWRA